MSKPRQVTKPSKRVADILRRVSATRNEENRWGPLQPNKIHNTHNSGELVDAAIKRLELAKRCQQMRDPDWYETYKGSTERTNLKFNSIDPKKAKKLQASLARRKRLLPIIGPGGTLLGYQHGGGYIKDDSIVPARSYSDGRPQTEILDAINLLVAELERMQYSDEITMRFVDKEAERERNNKLRGTNPDQFWADEFGTVTLNAQYPFGSTTTATVPFVLSTGNVRGVSQTVSCNSSGQDTQV